ncbi:nonstructural protein [robinz microvirus RP_188]|nr:nonstructural protein [robinz microvirus RP_188]
MTTSETKPSNSDFIAISLYNCATQVWEPPFVCRTVDAAKAVFREMLRPIHENPLPNVASMIKDYRLFNSGSFDMSSHKINFLEQPAFICDASSLFTVPNARG